MTIPRERSLNAPFNLLERQHLHALPRFREPRCTHLRVVLVEEGVYLLVTFLNTLLSGLVAVVVRFLRNPTQSVERRILAKDDENGLEKFDHRAELNELALARRGLAVLLVLLGHLGLYASQRVAAQQLPGVLQIPRTEEAHEPRETARFLVAVGRTELSTYGPLLRALVRLRPNLTPSGAEVDVDGFDGERVFVRVADCPYAGRKIRG